MSVHGYHGSYLLVDLNDLGHQARRMPIAEEDLRRTIGGVGLGVELLLRLHAPEMDAVSSPLAFVFSPLVGSPITTSAKFAVVCKSPLTHRWNDALASSGFAIAGKATGHDAIVIQGGVDRWSVLIVDGHDVQLQDGHDLIGLTTTQCESRLRERFGPDFEFAVIGPAGERQVRFASLSHDGRHAGRGGAGAVLGAKKIKAVVVRGSARCSWSNPQDLVEFSKELSRKSFGPATEKYRELGTASNLLAFNRLNTLPTRNFQQASFESAELLAPETLQRTRNRTQKSCRACTIGCEHLYSLSSGKKAVRLEYENLFALGPLCGVSDQETVLTASQRCDELGLDTISTGGTIAFAMECVSRGLLDASWLQFGDGNSLLEAIEQIGARRGLGNQLANGSRWLAKVIGDPAPRFAPHVKGLELPGYEPRTLQTMALGFAVGARGADHNRSSAYEVDFSGQVDRRNVSERSVALAIDAEDRSALLDSLILCKFLRGVFQNVWDESAKMLTMVTGWNVDATELRRASKRIVDQKKRFNILCGWTPSEDTLPDRFFDDSLEDGSARLDRSRLEELILQYNRQRGWTSQGFLSSEANSKDDV